MHQVEMRYPRINEAERFVRISLADVRAANDLVVSYDYDRDGWVILSDMIDPDDPSPANGELREVYFVPAWPNGEPGGSF